MPQLQLPIFPEGTTLINTNLGFIREHDSITYIYGHLPVFTHDVNDVRSFRMIASQLYINGSAKQSEWSRGRLGPGYAWRLVGQRTAPRAQLQSEQSRPGPPELQRGLSLRQGF